MAALWIFGLFAALSSIHLTLAWRDWPPEGEFENPINRVLISTFGWATFIIVLTFAVALDGLVWPGLAAAGLAAAFTLIRRKTHLARIYWLAAPLALAALGAALLMFQQVFGDQAFGLINIFPK